MTRRTTLRAVPVAPRALALAAMFALALSSCAYYNTYYLAKRYYFRATDGAPYLVERNAQSQVQNFTKAIDYSKKLISQYPKSKWVDDAYLLWAKSLLGRDDPLQTVNMLNDFTIRYPQSPIRAEATFFLGVANRQARKYGAAVAALDSFLAMAPKNSLAPYAHLERSRALTSLQRYGEAADAAGHVLSDFPKSELVGRARLARAEARMQQHDYEGARADFHEIGLRASTDEERFTFLLREADGLEAARKHDEELELLRGALAHETPPPAPIPGQLPPAGSDHYGRLTLRIGTALMLAGRLPEALQQYANVIKDYPKSALSAEAQYRIAYAYETSTDDFDRARVEYGKVKEQFGSSAFTTQAQQRLANLERIAQYRKGTGADSLEKKAEASLLTAELYLFQLDRPERALQEYRDLASRYAGTEIAARAMNAQGWVLSRKLDRRAAADSLFWEVVREYPETEAQLAARDYLEAGGHTVPDALIVPPKPKAPPVDTTTALTKPPQTVPPLGPAPAHPPGLGDSLGVQPGSLLERMRRLRQPPPGDTLAPPDSASADSLRRLLRPDSLLAPARRDTVRRIEK